MGKHRQDPVKCSMCDGDKRIKITHDGTHEWVPCPGCNGTGTQP